MDLDLTTSLINEILVERDSYALYVGIEYEKLLDYYTYCQTIGHSVVQCNKMEGRISNKTQKNKATYEQEGKAIYVSKEKSNKDDDEDPLKEGECSKINLVLDPIKGPYIVTDVDENGCLGRKVDLVVNRVDILAPVNSEHASRTQLCGYMP